MSDVENQSAGIYSHQLRGPVLNGAYSLITSNTVLISAWVFTGRVPL